MQFILISLVPIAVGFSYFFRIFTNYFHSNTNNTTYKSGDFPDLWGTYRSNLYFGMRTKTPQALMTGLAWNSINDIQGFSKMRHSCELDDHVNFGWTHHNGKSFGHQIITDKFHQTQLKISFLKISFESREAWSVKINAKPINKIKKKISLLFYLGYESDSSMKLKLFETKEFSGYIGWTPEVGNFAIGIPKIKGQDSNHLVIYDKIPKSKIWAISEKFSNLMKRKLQKGFYEIGNLIFQSNDLTEYAALDLKNSSSQLVDSNLLTFQFLMNNNENVEIIYFPINGIKKKELNERVKFYLKALDKSSSEKKKIEFHEKILKIFKPETKQLIPFLKYSISNLLGGISYFYGDSEVFSNGAIKRTLEGSLFTDVPARANFPRGFYWDSGFHNILIGKWDPRLSMEILSNWIEKIDENGWVGREQILGDEARSKVPSGYITQNPEYSNPPASLLPIEMLTNCIKSSNNCGLENFQVEEIKIKLKKMYPKLVSHFNWFIRTQSANPFLNRDFNDSYQFLFRWRGRTDHHTLTSGLDDYPRGNVPSEYELHVDLLSWMAFAARALSNIQNQLDIGADTAAPDFDSLYKLAMRNLNEFHWDESRGCFSDLTISENGNELIFVPNTGYVSLFPMLFGLVEVDDPKLVKLFDIIEDPEKLWTNYGIRSLSKSDSFYNHGDKYWTGPIWINLNYLILSALKKYYSNSERGTRIYQNLRINLITNMSKEWKLTGFIWEQYNDQTGKGQRSRPFAGWSSLIALIVAEEYH